jgi:hypothetical protein
MLEVLVAKHFSRAMCRFLALLPLLLAACQPLPHPFADNRPPPDSPLLTPRDSAGVLFEPMAGAPAELAEGMAAALREREIPASTQGRNKRSFELRLSPGGAPASGAAALGIAWELRAADGRSLGRGAATGSDANGIAAAAAPEIARLLQDEPPAMAGSSEPAIALRPVTGAPGDGGRTLTRAMDYALRLAHVPLTEQAGAASFVLTGTVALSPPAAGQQQVKVHWALLKPDGREIGRVDQENAVPAGSLDGAWGEVAYAVASAAAPGVAALIQRAKAEIGS